MRINAHAHIFNLRSVFTPETLQILMNRFKLEGMPKPVRDLLYARMAEFLRGEIDAETIFQSLDERAGATDELTQWFGKLKLGDAAVDLQIDGVLARLGGKAQAYIREKLLELCDLDKQGAIKQNWFDYLEYLRVGLMPSMEQVTDEVMGQMGADDGLVALAMDITDGSDDGTLYAKQLSAMSDAVLAYPGRLFPFVMVNPMRQGYFDIMKEALEKKGFWGVKVYPSLGYPVVSDQMEPVYRYCEANRVPILTHCTAQGFCKNKETGQWASPDKWEPVLASFPDLILCFGHFGADDALIHESMPQDAWPSMILELMHRYKHVFADISFHTDAMIGVKGMDKETARQNYRRNLTALLQAAPSKDRLLFGTDYWMVRTVTRDVDYWAFYKNMFTPAQFNRLTRSNPAAYLGLPTAPQPSGWLIDRHLAFFRSKKWRVQRAPAKWLRDELAAAGDATGGFVVTGSAPSWSRNNWIHYFLYEHLYGGGVFRKADRDARLPFETYGRFKLANLRYWDESPELAIFDLAVKGLASDIIKVYRKRNRKWVTYNKGAGVTEKVARRELIAALKKPDWYVYQLAELCDALFIFSHPDQQGGADA